MGRRPRVYADRASMSRTGVACAPGKRPEWVGSRILGRGRQGRAGAQSVCNRTRSTRVVARAVSAPVVDADPPCTRGRKRTAAHGLRGSNSVLRGTSKVRLRSGRVNGVESAACVRSRAPTDHDPPRACPRHWRMAGPARPDCPSVCHACAILRVSVSVSAEFLESYRVQCLQTSITPKPGRGSSSHPFIRSDVYWARCAQRQYSVFQQIRGRRSRRGDSNPGPHHYEY
jgi:hypothetical protein